MKRYVFEVVIEEGNDEYWEDFEDREVSGVDEVTDAIKDAMWACYNDNATVTLKRYEDENEIE